MRGTLRRLGVTAVMVATTVATTTVPARAESTTGTISGQITGAENSVSAQVLVYDTSFTFINSTIINPDGSYRVEIPAGDYKLEISVDGLSQWAHQKSNFFEADTFTVTAGAVLTVNETLLPAGTLTGTVLDGTTPVARVGVTATPLDGSKFGAAFTDEQGRFTMRLLVGSYRVSFDIGDGLTQYHPQRMDPNLAEPVTVMAGERIEITETLIPTGSASGSLTEDGVGVVGALVFWQRPDDLVTGFSTTDAEGRYRLPRLFPGEYTVQFILPDQRTQWAHGKTSAETADRFIVTAGAETVVDETVLPAGQVRVHAVDAKTGEPITNFCAATAALFACTQDDVITFEKVPVGRHEITVIPNSDAYLSPAFGVVEVTAGGVADATVAVEPAAIITTVVRDRRSGEPVPGVCVQALPLQLASLAGGGGYCSDDQGRVRIGGLAAGTYTLFAVVQDGVHGMQWVGPSGGTGSQFAAGRITVEGGQTVAAPPVRLDQAGSVTGLVTDKANGAPVPDVFVTLLTAHPGIGDFGPSATTDVDGRYTFANLGPYDWPLHYIHVDYAAQWSGAAPSRLLAEPVSVKAGRTVTADAALTAGTLVRGTVRQASGEPLPDAFVTAYTAAVGDIAGSDFVDGGTFQMRVLGPTLVRFHVDTGTRSGWHREANEFDDATIVFVPARDEQTVELTVNLVGR